MCLHLACFLNHMASCLSLPPALPFFFLPYVLPFLTFKLHYSPIAWHALIPILYVWIFIPFLDILIPATRISATRLTHLQRKALQSKPSFKLAIHLWCPTQLVLLIWGAYRVQQFAHSVCGLRLIALLWALGLIAAEGIVCSHELLHRNSRLERCLGKILLASVLYAHFAIEHTGGHHVNVATPDDPATMRQGESFYHFLPRTVLGGYRSAWRLETKRLKRCGLPFWTYKNEMLVLSLVQCLLCVAFYCVLGVRALAVFLFQAAYAVVLLEQINAIEHYGLLRNKLSCGEYERVGPRHSWDAPHAVSNYALFKLQVHADHHLHVSRRYQTLELTEGSPQLPLTYLSLLQLLWVPPLWRAVMDPVLMQYRERWRQEDSTVFASELETR